MPTAKLREQAWWRYASRLLRFWWAFLGAYGIAVGFNILGLVAAEGLHGLVIYRDVAHALFLDWWLALIAINPLLALLVALLINDVATLFAIWGRQEQHLFERQKLDVEKREREAAIEAAKQEVAERALQELGERGKIE